MSYFRVMAEENGTRCLNCNEPVNGKYCGACGQSIKVGTITFRETLNGFLSSTFALEGPLLYTIKQLIVNPGKHHKEFISGKRKTYYKPVAFFIVLTAAYILLRALLGYDPLEGQVQDEAPADYAEMQELSLKAARFMVDNINNIMFTLVLSIGLALKIFFRRRYNLAEYTTIGFYVAGIYILFGILFMFFQHFTGLRINQIQLIILFLYVFYTQWSLFGKVKIGYLLKYALVGVTSILFYMVFGFSVSLLIVSIMN